MLINYTRYRNRLFFCTLLLIGLMLTVTSVINAEEKTSQETVLVVEKSGGTEADLALRHTLVLKVKNLPAWLQQPGNDLSQLTLYIDGMALKDLMPSLMEGDKLLFDLRRTDENKDAWSTILSRKGKGFFSRLVPVTVGFENGVQLASAAKFRLVIINEFWFYTFLVLFGAAVLLFLYLVKTSDVIRDAGPQPLQRRGINSHKPIRKTYSLARTQMALWFFTIIFSYIFIWMTTSDLASLTPTVVGLMGISAATGLGAAIVDSSKLSEQKNQLQSLDEQQKTKEVELEKLQSEIGALQTALAATPPPSNLAEQQSTLAAKQVELVAKQQELRYTEGEKEKLQPAVASPATKNFIKDILSDDDGVSFHRCQIFAWTIVLTVIFISRVFDTLNMPNFDGTLLAMMGISGATYIGFKLPERQG